MLSSGHREGAGAFRPISAFLECCFDIIAVEGSEWRRAPPSSGSRPPPAGDDHLTRSIDDRAGRSGWSTL